MNNEEIIVQQNPQNPAPQDILDTLTIIDVKYYGFDSELHEGKIVMHKDVAEDVKKFFGLALELKFPIKSVIPINDPKYKWDDDVSCNDNNSSGFNYRTISGNPTKLSKHAKGLAFDINPVQNIYVRYDESQKEVFRSPEAAEYNKDASGTLVSGDPLVTLMKRLGWVWGGDWTRESGREDYQHFEKEL